MVVTIIKEEMNPFFFDYVFYPTIVGRKLFLLTHPLGRAAVVCSVMEKSVCVGTEVSIYY